MTEVRTLDGGVALVTGASRGIGRGIALALADAGAIVYITGVFGTIEREKGRLDLLVNNATGMPDLDFLFSDRPFWDLQPDAWDDLIAVGLRSHFIASQHAARLMTRQCSGLIVNISSAGAKRKIGIVPYGVGKAALDHMTAEMADELRSYNVAVVSLWPPPSKTEGMLADATDETNVEAWSSTEFTGRVIAALAADDPLGRTGKALSVRPLAAELGVDDDAILSG